MGASVVAGCNAPPVLVPSKHVIDLVALVGSLKTTRYATSGLPHCKIEMNGEAIAHHEDPIKIAINQCTEFLHDYFL
jgi:hypothetical protein